MLADTLTKGESTLVENGQSDRVLQLRHDYQLAMRDDLVALVEDQLERKVIAFMSQNHIDPDLAVEVFVLEPGGAAGFVTFPWTTHGSASLLKRRHRGCQAVHRASLRGDSPSLKDRRVRDGPLINDERQTS